MKKIKELKSSSLNNTFNVDSLQFTTTDEIEPFNGIIGQERALEAIKSAMQIPQKGFNLYISGTLGIGKTAYALSVVNSLSEKLPVPQDYCYINNFENPNEPIAVCLAPGEGMEFKQDMNRFINSIITRINKELTGDMYEKEKKTIVDRYKRAKENLMREFDKSTFEKGFKVRNTENGIYFSPVHNGVVLDEKSFKVLDEKTKKYFEEKSPEIQEQTLQVLKELDALDKKCEQVLKEWENNLATFAVTQCMSDLKIKYKKNLKIQNFLYSIQSDVVKNVEFFKKDNSEKDLKMMSNPYLMQQMMKAKNQKPWERYRVNLVINNDRLQHAPVVLCKNPNYFDLFGKLEFESTPQGTKTNYSMLKPGLIHKANGGFLIINIRDLLLSAPTWEAFKRVLRNQELAIDSSRDIHQPITVVSLKPEPIPINMQVILIGSELHYQQLCAMDADFKKLFKVKADFDDTYDRNKENVKKLVQFIAYVCKKHSLLPLDKTGVKEIIEYSSKCAGNQNKLTAIMQDISDLIIESNFIATSSRKKIITDYEVQKALEAKTKRFSKYNDALNKMIKQGDIIISTSGKKVGQINGLTIAVSGDCSFGQPVRITANTFIGKSGVLNIEREVSMSGKSHSKGVFILSAYIGEKYAQDIPLSLTASICFEQLYNPIDGDSASSTELYAILSSLADVPINQSLAVTGSVNQKGEIQPIGGVTDKIEGFFKVCKEKGLNEENGVLIPYQNIKNLTLSDEIVEAVKSGKFHIYPVNSIDEGIEILTGIPAGKQKEDGTYEEGTINYLVYKKLEKYAQNSAKYNN